MKKFLMILSVFVNNVACDRTQRPEKVLRSVSLEVMKLRHYDDYCFTKIQERARRSQDIIKLSHTINDCASQAEFYRLCKLLENLQKDLAGLLFSTNFVDFDIDRKGYEIFNQLVAQLDHVATLKNLDISAIPERIASPDCYVGKKSRKIDTTHDSCYSPVDRFEIPHGAGDEDYSSRSSSCSSTYSYINSLGHHFKNPSDASTPRWVLVESSDGSMASS